MISEKSVSAAVVATGPTRVNQFSRGGAPPVTITSMSFLLLNSIATFTVLVMMEMSLSTFEASNHFRLLGRAAAQCDRLTRADEFSLRTAAMRRFSSAKLLTLSWKELSFRNGS